MTKYTEEQAHHVRCIIGSLRAWDIHYKGKVKPTGIAIAKHIGLKSSVEVRELVRIQRNNEEFWYAGMIVAVGKNGYLLTTNLHDIEETKNSMFQRGNDMVKTSEAIDRYIKREANKCLGGEK